MRRTVENYLQIVDCSASVQVITAADFAGWLFPQEKKRAAKRPLAHGRTESAQQHERQANMPTSPITAPTSPPDSSLGVGGPERTDRVYKGLTIAAMLLLLASLWLF